MDRDDLVPEARRTAAVAAARVGVAVSTVAAMDALVEVSRLFGRVWRVPDTSVPVAAELLRAVAHTGGYVAAARTPDGGIVGASVGLHGREHGRATLHSHITGVLDGHPGAGFALKLHQRAWALAAGIDEITWTFDPLVRRNAYFNLTKLGAEGRGFHPSFYGVMADGLNAGDESDRVEVVWAVAGERAVAAASGDAPDPALAGAAPVLSISAAGDPVRHAGPAAGPWRAAVPADLLALRATAPDRARAWRRELRAVLADAEATRRFPVTMSRSGWYLLTHRRDRVIVPSDR